MGDVSAPSGAARRVQDAYDGTVLGRWRPGRQPVGIAAARFRGGGGREVLGVDHQRHAQARRSGQGALKAFVVHRREVLGAGADEEAFKPTTPASTSASIEARLVGVTPPQNPTSTRSFPSVACLLAAREQRSTVAGTLSMGISTRVVIPPAAAAAVAVAKPSQSRVTRLAHVHMGVHGAGEDDSVGADGDLLRGQFVRTDREQRGDNPVPHPDGPGHLPAAGHDPLGADQEVQRTVAQGATMYRQGRSPQGTTVLPPRLGCTSTV